MSVELSARTVSRTEGVDGVRALQRVLYRSAKQEPGRRFHALFDKVARSDVLWKAWVQVCVNQGAPGVDGITIDGVEESGVREFLDELAAELKEGKYRPRPLRRVHIPKPGKPGITRPLGIPASVTGWSWQPPKSSSNPSSRPTSSNRATGFDPAARPGA
jgi:RNA-directed DNA polymerase